VPPSRLAYGKHERILPAECAHQPADGKFGPSRSMLEVSRVKHVLLECASSTDVTRGGAPA